MTGSGARDAKVQVMRVTSPAVALAALLALAGAQASAAEPRPAKAARSCFSAHKVSNFAVVDDRTVNIRVGVKDVYRLDLLGVCPDIDWQNKIAIKSHGSSFICSPLDATLLAAGPFGRLQRCEVKQVRRLTVEEIQALPSRERP